MARLKNTSEVRVSAVLREGCVLQFPDGERIASITGRFRFEAEDKSDFPAVGDWVSAEITGPESALVHSIRPRRSVLSRKAAGTTMEEQILAANVDVAFIVTAFNEDFNVRRIERYLALVKQAGLLPVILVNKSDLAKPDDSRFTDAGTVAAGGPVYKVSAHGKEGIEVVIPFLAPDKTGIFLGSSGVGKSSILNVLLGSAVQATQEIRLSDAKGRHTTTTRQMFSLPQGGYVIDTPGLREIQLWGDESLLPEVYTDVAALIQSCQFSNCGHDSEPGCAIKGALESATLSADRWAGYIKLQKELSTLKRKQDPEEQANTKKRWKKKRP